MFAQKTLLSTELSYSQGEAFVDFLRGGNMTVVNGRKGRDAFTCVSGRGCSVVDYCIVALGRL